MSVQTAVLSREELLGEALRLLDEAALLATGLPPEQRHPLLGTLMVAHGIVHTAREAGL